MERTRPPWWHPLSQNVIRLALVVFAVILLIDLVRSIDHNYQISRQIRDLTGQIASEHDRMTALNEAIAYYKTDTYKELAARRDLGLAKPGETMVLAPMNRDPNSVLPGTAPTVTDPRIAARQAWNDQPPYEQWWLLFFGPQDQLEAVFGS